MGKRVVSRVPNQIINKHKNTQRQPFSRTQQQQQAATREAKKTPEDNSRVCTQIKWIEHAQNIGMRPWTTNVCTRIHRHRHTYTNSYIHTLARAQALAYASTVFRPVQMRFSLHHTEFFRLFPSKTFYHPCFFLTQPRVFTSNFFPLSKSDCMQNILCFIFPHSFWFAIYFSSFSFACDFPCFLFFWLAREIFPI